MSKYYFDAFGEKEIDYNPQSLEDELNQNLFMILSTLQGSAILNRSFGIDPEIIDETHEIAKALITSSIYELVETYEPRINIENIEFNSYEIFEKTSKLVAAIYYTVQEVQEDGDN